MFVGYSIFFKTYTSIYLSRKESLPQLIQYSSWCGYSCKYLW